MDVLESEHLLQLRLANMTAYAALHASPNADVEKGSQQIAEMFKRSMSTIPYLGVGESDDDSQSERLAAVEKYKKLRKELKT